MRTPPRCWRSTRPGSTRATPRSRPAHRGGTRSAPPEAARPPVRRHRARVRSPAGWPSRRCPAAGSTPGSSSIRVYVHPAARGQGIGRALLAAADRLDRGGRDLDHPESSIFPENTASLALHRAPGSGVVGTRERIAQHHGRWRDTLLLLNAAARSCNPVQVRRRRPGAARAVRRGRSSWVRAVSKLAGSPAGTGSGTDQCSAAARPSSSWARSHTVMTRSSSCWTSPMWRGRSRGSGRRCRAAAAIAPGSIAGRRVRPGRCRRDGAGPAPQRGGQVRAGRVGGAHEQHPPRGPGRRGGQGVQGAGDQLQVGAAAVALGAAAGDDPGLLQHVQVVGEQVGRHAQHRGQLGRRGVPGEQRVGDLQPGRVGQRRMHGGAPGQVG